MSSSRVLRTVRRWGLIPLLAGFSVFQLGGCDPDVRNAFLTGIQTTLVTLTTALINTFFQALQVQIPTSQPIVRAVFDGMKQFVG